VKLRGILGFGLSLTVLSVGVFPTLLPKTALAQSSCQNTIKKVVNQMRIKGVRQVHLNIDKNVTNYRNTGNPTNRTDTISLTLSHYSQSGIPDQKSAGKIENILKSPVLLKTWADLIVANCEDTAVVTFIQDQSDWVLDYAIQADSTTRKRECNFDIKVPLPWNQYNCV
jgi:hypothetical protein